MSDYSNRRASYKSNRRQTKINSVGLQEPMLNMFCRYALSTNDHIHTHAITSLNRLMSSFTNDDFDNNQNMIIKFNFLKEILKNRMQGLRNRDMILANIDMIMDISTLKNDDSITTEMSNDEVYNIEQTVSMMLNNILMEVKAKELDEVLQDYLAADFRGKNTTFGSLKESLNNLQAEIRRNEINKDSADTLFRLSEMEQTIPDIHKYVTSPSYKLVTGMQGLNSMLGGGFQKERVYSFFGASGSGKTTTLENIMYQLWKYNKDFMVQDKSKKPCIVLLTMENLVVETVSSLFHIMTKGKSLDSCATPEDAIQQFKEHCFEFDPDNKNSIELFIKYKPVNSVDTGYMYKIVEDLEDEGFETIAFLQDYMMRIKPSIVTKDVYQDLGTVVNDFKTFAMTKKIPVITASQLNREAMKIIDEGRNANKLDSIKKLGRSNIGESIRIDTNLDATFIIVPEFDREGNKYLGIKMTKHRYKLPSNFKLDSLFQPFYPKSVALVEDIYEIKPAYKESLICTDIEEVTSKFGTTEHISMNNPAKRLEALNYAVPVGAVDNNVPNKVSIKKDITKNYITPPIENRIEKTKMEDTKEIEMKPMIDFDDGDSFFNKKKVKEVIFITPITKE